MRVTRRKALVLADWILDTRPRLIHVEVHSSTASAVWLKLERSCRCGNDLDGDEHYHEVAIQPKAPEPETPWPHIVSSGGGYTRLFSRQHRSVPVEPGQRPGPEAAFMGPR